MHVLCYSVFFPLLVFVICEENEEISVTEAENATSLNLVKFSDFCGETITESQFLLESLNYPEEYPPNVNCEITLQGDSCPLYYKFRFLDFNIENSTGCTKDRLEIGQADAVCGKRTDSKTYLAMNGTLKLRFITDDSNSGKGYKILVTRIEECLNVTKKFPDTVLTTFNGVNKNPNFKECCSDSVKTSKHFFIKSPNFPTSMSVPNDCVIQIHKSSSDVCRLRIKFQFFWLGNSLDCREGYLQIDGNSVCGCKKELNLISPFFENIKTLRFVSQGSVRDSYSGFEAEVFQDDCPKKISTNSGETGNETWKYTEDVNQKLNYLLPSSDKVEVYFYTYPEERIHKKDREERNYLETENINTFLGNNQNDYASCLKWNQIQFNEMFPGGNIRTEQCNRDANEINKEKRCLEFIKRRGFIFSPGYPFFYPGNLNICYRFPKLPGVCGIRIHFLDFRIGYSNVCSEEGIDIGNVGVFCGMSLWNKMVTLDLRYKEYEDVTFTTTTPKCAQGFKAIYEQLPCQEMTTEIPPPITKIWPVPPPTTFRPLQKCGRIVREEYSTIMNEQDSSECLFVIEKFTENVCRFVLNFEESSIDCSVESLTVNGKNYCGNQSGRTVIVDVGTMPIEIFYRKFGTLTSGGIFKIRVIQDFRNCIEPPAQLSK